MVKRRRGPPTRSNAAQRNPERAQMVTDLRPPEAVSDPDAAMAAEVPGLATEGHTPSVHDALLETVSADALEAGTGQHDSEGATAQDSVEAAETMETGEATAAGTEPAPTMQPPEALEAASDAVSVPGVTIEPEVAPAAEPLTEPAAIAAVETAPASARLAVAMAPEAILHPTGATLNVIGEITEANATILAFLRNEGSAAMAHWQSLSGAKTPADAIRIQVDEMQRAADASLTCFNALARRAGRLAAGLGRV